MATLLFFLLFGVTHQNLPVEVVNKLLDYNAQLNKLERLEQFGILPGSDINAKQDKMVRSGYYELATISGFTFLILTDSSEFRLHTPGDYLSSGYVVWNDGRAYDFKRIKTESEFISFVDINIISPEIQPNEYEELIKIYFSIYCQGLTIYNSENRDQFDPKVIRENFSSETSKYSILEIEKGKIYNHCFLAKENEDSEKYFWLCFEFTWRSFKVSEIRI